MPHPNDTPKDTKNEQNRLNSVANEQRIEKDKMLEDATDVLCDAALDAMFSIVSGLRRLHKDRKSS